MYSLKVSLTTFIKTSEKLLLDSVQALFPVTSNELLNQGGVLCTSIIDRIWLTRKVVCLTRIFNESQANVALDQCYFSIYMICFFKYILNVFLFCLQNISILL